MKTIKLIHLRDIIWENGGMPKYRRSNIRYLNKKSIWSTCRLVGGKISVERGNKEKIYKNISTFLKGEL